MPGIFSSWTGLGAGRGVLCRVTSAMRCDGTAAGEQSVIRQTRTRCGEFKVKHACMHASSD
eukprot:6195908-Pleurochrysis_carterae.AAC.2